MSEGFAAPPPPEPAARVRPGVVSIANLLLVVGAAAFAVLFILSITTIGTLSDVFEEEFAGTEAEGTEGVAVGFLIAIWAVFLLFAIGLVVLAALNNQGKNPARIVTWVLGGIGVCCAGLQLVSSGIGSSMGGTGGTNGVDQEELQRRIEDALPSWYGAATIGVLVIAILALAVALVLLALPKANEFFRKPQQPFEPPTPNYPQVG
jgi:hypothetical protein